MRATRLALATAPLAAAAGLAWSLAEARAFTLRRFTLPVLPPGSPDLRVLQLSDLHLVPRQRKKIAWVRRLAALAPDLVISTGDNLASPHAVPAVLEAHGELLDLPGVFVLGSNDYYGPRKKNPARYLEPATRSRKLLGDPLPTHSLVAGFVQAGWHDLTNRRDRLVVNGLRLDFVGVDDAHLDLDKYEVVAGPPAPDASLTLGVTHAPYRRVLDAMTGDGADVVIAGHTHGGQLCLPGFGALVTNCDLPRRQAKGVSRWTAPASPGLDGAPAPQGTRTAWMHVSAGLGTNPYTPVRFACRPEASLLTLTARPV
ncbi:MAG: metallophosphoesterase [Kineosporiaceae bacterium]